MTRSGTIRHDLYALYKKYGKFSTTLIDPPWTFKNSTGKGAPQHKRLYRYATLTNEEIFGLPVGKLAEKNTHVYCWCPNAFLHEGLQALAAWGFTFKTVLIWHKIRKDGGSDGRSMGFYFRNVTEVCLFGVKGKLRTFQPGRTQVNYLAESKIEHSRKPEKLYEIIEQCSPGPFLEMFARYTRENWCSWGDEV
jgi:N6-adenosine-specific RNA methylase IME4